jgi:hypothetical protein
VDPLTLLMTLLAAGAGALSTYVLARIDRVQMMKRIDRLAEQRERDRRVLTFALAFLADVAKKNEMGERFSTGILRVLSFTPASGSHGIDDSDTINDIIERAAS